MKRIIIALLILAMCALAKNPAETYMFAIHGNAFNGLPNSILYVQGTVVDGKCHYVGKISDIEPENGDCPGILVLHLAEISGSPETGLLCSYDEDMQGQYVAVTTERHKSCPDLMAVAPGSFAVYGVYMLGKGDNQADYWNSVVEPTFTWNLVKGTVVAHKEIGEQVRYRMHYDYETKTPYSTFNSQFEGD